MGMFDNVSINAKIPGIFKYPVILQTKDYKCLLNTYKVTSEGFLFEETCTNTRWEKSRDKDDWFGSRFGYLISIGRRFRRIRRNLTFKAYGLIGKELKTWELKFKKGVLVKATLKRRSSY